MKKIPLVAKILTGFVLGTVVGLAMSAWCAPETVKKVVPFVSPFGAVLVAMLKMVVYPVILFSLILGAASLPIRRSGKVGALVIAWYTGTSVVATVFGVAMAYLMNPKMEAAEKVAGAGIEGAKAVVPEVVEDWFHDPSHYRPELPSTNYSHYYE